jgi:predicted PolB exonuclease-like 3'-5' exonuclease
MAFVNEDGSIKMQSFSGKDEVDILRKTQAVLRKIGSLNYFICGHNVKGFDIPMLAKRMMINGILPPKMLPSYDTKPWEVKAIDTKEIWQYGAYTAIGSLDLMCACLDIPTPKDGEVNGGMVHEAYRGQGRLKEISEYCERDVDVLVDAIMKLKSLK